MWRQKIYYRYGAFALNGQCVSFASHFNFIDLETCKNKRKVYEIKVFRFFSQIKIGFHIYRQYTILHT